MDASTISPLGGETPFITFTSEQSLDFQAIAKDLGITAVAKEIFLKKPSDFMKIELANKEIVFYSKDDYEKIYSQQLQFKRVFQESIEQEAPEEENTKFADFPDPALSVLSDYILDSAVSSPDEFDELQGILKHLALGGDAILKNFARDLGFLQEDIQNYNTFELIEFLKIDIAKPVLLLFTLLLRDQSELKSQKGKILYDKMLKFAQSLNNFSVYEKARAVNSWIKTEPLAKQVKAFCSAEINFNRLPSCLFELTNLRCLIIQDSSLNKLPTQIGNLKELEMMYIQSSQITEFPSIDDLKKLTKLDVINNKLTSLPSFKMVLHLNAENNQITSLPSLNECLTLDYLNVSRNMLKELPSFENCIKLTYLDIGFNPLEKWPLGLEKLLNLNRVVISPDQAKKFASEIEQLKKANPKIEIKIKKNRFRNLKDF